MTTVVRMCDIWDVQKGSRACTARRLKDQSPSAETAVRTPVQAQKENVKQTASLRGQNQGRCKYSGPEQYQPYPTCTQIIPIKLT